MEQIPQVARPAIHWDQITNEILCPLCTYNLRGLSEPRCPECGYRFNWTELFESNVVHPWLFEHHPESNVRSMARTMAAALSPRRFWNAIRPTHRLRGRRLTAFLLVPLLITALIPLTSLTLSQSIQIRIDNRNARAWFSGYVKRMPPTSRQNILAAYGTYEAYYEARYPTSLSTCMSIWWQQLPRNYDFWLVAMRVGLVLAWPFLTLLTLLIFGQSRRRARIRRLHLFRCVAYASTMLIVLSVLLSFILILMGDGVQRWRLFGYLGLLIVLGSGVLAFTYHLIVAFRVYLRFPHPEATVLVSQFIVLLIGIQLLLLPMLIFDRALF